MAKKLGEEAFEVVIDAMHGNREAVVRESADLLYNLVVLWVASGVDPKDVWKEMDRRERLFGIAEKLLKRSGARRKMRPQGRGARGAARARRAALTASVIHLAATSGAAMDFRRPRPLSTRMLRQRLRLVHRRRRQAIRAVADGLVSFAESSFFPVPPDTMLIPMSLARPDKAWSYATLCT